MPIRKGGAYGYEAPVSPDLPVLADDVELAAFISNNGREPCTVEAGDLRATLGGGAAAGVPTRAYPIDLLFVELDGESAPAAVAHVLARRRFLAGECAAAMNAAWVGSLYLGPRSHPNDGLVDVTIGSLPLQQRILARSRARTGNHLPHPALQLVRRPDWVHTFPTATPIYIDGVRLGRFRTVAIHVEADAGIVIL